MQIFPTIVRKLWDLLEIRVLVLLSLGVQCFLILTGNSRKYSASNKLSILLWVAYFLADWAVTVSLSVLSSNAGNSEDHSVDPKLVITAFWAPFLLLHLGGPDTITAYSLEDNELWRRRLLSLVSQVVTAAYVLLRAWTSTTLNFLAVLVFISGVIKSGERIWVLWSASSEQLRESMLSPPDPGPNYARYMEEYCSKEDEGFQVSLEKLIKIPKEHETSLPRPENDSIDTEQGLKRLINAEILEKAFSFFETFKLLFADLILSFQDIEKSRSFFKNLHWEDTFKVIEVELGFVYDVFYTKAVVVYSFVGGFSRCFSLCCISLRCFSFFSISSVSVAFFITEKRAYSRVDEIITYVLLAGAIILELYAVILQLCSDWTMQWLSKHNLLYKYNLIRSFLLNREKRYWSNTMAQYNLIRRTCLEDNPAKSGRFMQVSWFFWKYIQKVLCIHRLLEKHRHKYSVEVLPYLKQEIVNQLVKKLESDINNSKKLCAYRGDRVIQNAKSLDKISEKDQETIKGSVAIEVEFDQSILLWHIATDLCFYSDETDLDSDKNYRKASQLLSNYMLYLLVMCPFMLPNGIGQIRFRDTCAEATYFFKERGFESDEQKTRNMLLDVRTKIPPSKVKGDRSKSVLFDACRLAHSLRSTENKWELICHVWVEMLSYAASHCQWNQHAQQLTQGGELLTHVWLLMAHLGITEQFQISEGYERAKLNVE